MFTGLIQAKGTVVQVVREGQGRTFTIDISGLPEKPAVGASVAVSGACLTVTGFSGGNAIFNAVPETIARSSLGACQPGTVVNLEPALRAGDPLDGHIVTGHIDDVGRVLEVRPAETGHEMTFSLPDTIQKLVATKGSIAIDGISLTVARAESDRFTVAVIPHTWRETTLCERSVGDPVNLEADILARYISRQREMSGPGLSEEFLREQGFA